MNTQTKKILTITAVVVFHLAVITVMVAQPGCKSDSQKSGPAEPVTSANVAPPAEAVANTPSSEVVASAPPALSPPTRPAPELPPPTPMPTPVVVAHMESSGEPIPATTVSTAPVNTPPPTIIYTVKSGDRGLIPIARANGVTLKELLAANPGMTETTLIHPGDKINIVHSSSAAASTTTAPAATPDASSLYTVVSGDNLTRIAHKLNTTIAALRTTNNLKTDTVIAGQKLTIPAASAAPAPTSNPAATSNPATTAAVDSTTAGGEYTMMAGENLTTVARKFGVSVNDLMTLNGLTDATARLLRAGKVIKLPPNAKPAAGTSEAPSPSPASGPTPLPSPPVMINPPAPASSSNTTVTPATVDMVGVPVVPVH